MSGDETDGMSDGDLDEAPLHQHPFCTPAVMRLASSGSNQNYQIIMHSRSMRPQRLSLSIDLDPSRLSEDLAS
jgi:hypothetical protein